MKRIILVGCGQIGSRHLQGVASLNDELDIHVVEPREEAVKIGLERFNQIPRSKDAGRVSLNWHSRVADLPPGSDIAIVATSSLERFEVVSALLAMAGHKRFLLEKMVCQSETDYSRLIELFKNNSAKGWVNTIRRYNSTYRNAAELFRNDKIFLQVCGEQFGLGSNAIHFLDLFVMLTGSRNLVLTGDFLDPLLSENKRGKAFVEIEGVIVGKDQKGDFLSVSSFPFNNGETTVTIISDKMKIAVNETQKTVEIFKRGSRGPEKERYYEPLVSGTTPSVLADIFKKDRCLLPTLEESFPLHEVLFRLFREHISSIKGHALEKLPVT